MDPRRGEAAGAEAEKTRVNSVALSSFVDGRPIDLVKMDVEGAEHLVLADLVESGAIGLINELVVEYHHQPDPRGGSLGEFLRRLERAGFEYQIDVAWGSPPSRGRFQDVLLHAFRAGDRPSGAQGMLR